LSERDKRVIREPHVGEAFVADFREASLQQFAGGGWDNVAWVGNWDFDVADVRCPVRLWYGEQDAMAAPDNGTWLQEHVPEAVLTLRPGYVPSHHGGFLGGDFGYAGQPEAFARKLRDVLDG
jgi:pimeloyl-ACP methyl ester carboxylesterase